MKNPINYIALVLFMLALVGCDKISIDPDKKAATEAAEKGLETLKEFAALDPARGGFANSSEVQAATLGAAIPVHYMYVNETASHSPENEPHNLFNDEEEYIYAVEVNGQVRSAVTVRKINSEWEVIELGHANIIMPIVEVKNRHKDQNGMKDKHYMLVRIPAMYHYWVAYEEDDKYHFIHVWDRDEHNFKKHDVHPAKQVVADILESVKNFESAVLEP